jgi:simple sugar transport system ATP-binding protein
LSATGDPPPLRAALRDVHRRFGAVRALDGASLELRPAEIHALLGENGAGKTTLVRVLCGQLQPDSGRVEIDGESVELRGPRHARALGIGLVHQHFMGVPALSVADNLALGEPGGFTSSPRERIARARELLARHALDVDPAAPAAELGVAQQQRLEIAKVLAGGARVLVLDEPTAVLAPPEVRSLLELMRALRAQGRTLVFISHKLEEITAVCDRVTVLRAGRTVATRTIAGVEAAQLGRWMVGEALPARGAPPGQEPGPVALRLVDVRARGLEGVDLEIRSGEVVALAGIDGNGQAALEEVLAGVRPLRGGHIELVRPPLGLVPGDRQRTGMVLDLSLGENVLLPEVARRGGLLRRADVERAAADAIARFDIRAQPGSAARALSGGNQQKLSIARALHEAPGVLVAVNPTRGLDVRASAAVRDALRAQARAGAAVLLISTELDEVLELGDRIGVLFRGRILRDAQPRPGRERIGELMLGAGAA